MDTEDFLVRARREAGIWDVAGTEVELIVIEEGDRVGLEARRVEDGEPFPVGAVLSHPRSRKLSDG